MPAQVLKNNYNVQQTFIGCNEYKEGTYTNSTGSTVVIPMGTVIGRVLATQLLLPQVSTATDGSEMPRGVVGEDYSIANGASQVITYCYAGDINQNALILGGSDTLDTVVRTVTTGGGTVGDLLQANTDIKLYPSLELSNYDN